MRLNSGARVYSEEYGDHPGHDTIAHPAPRDGLPHSATLGLGSYTALILTQAV